jgi:glutathione synthase/RimK-type ligase-like ATP-grasp enzyme
MSHPTLGVMALYMNQKKLEELNYFRRLITFGKKLNLNVIIFTPEDVLPEKNQITALQYDIKKAKWFSSIQPMPDLIYDRCRFQKNYRFALLRKFRTQYPKLTYINHPMAHKWPVHQLLYKNRTIRPFLPETIKYKQASDLISFLQNHSLVYLKPSNGTGGRGILSIRRLTDGLCLVQGRDLFRKIITPRKMKIEQISIRFNSWGLKDRYLIQQGIPLALPDGRVHDYRLLIQKNDIGQWEVTGCAGRVGPARSITSNLHGGGMALPMMKLLHSRFSSTAKINEIKETMEQLSHEVVIQLEKQYGRLCEMALDIAVSPSGQVWLLEVNPKPAREVFRLIKETETYEKAIRRPLEYALWLHKQEK